MLTIQARWLVVPILLMAARCGLADPIRLTVGGYDGDRALRTTRILPEGFTDGTIHLKTVALGRSGYALPFFRDTGFFPAVNKKVNSEFRLDLGLNSAASLATHADEIALSGISTGTITGKFGSRALSGGYGGSVTTASVVGVDPEAGLDFQALAPFLDPSRLHLKAVLTGGAKNYLSIDLIVDPAAPGTSTAAASSSTSTAGSGGTVAARSIVAAAEGISPPVIAHATPEPGTLLGFAATFALWAARRTRRHA